MKNIKNLCTPAWVYFWMSMMSVLALFVQNCTNQNMYCLGFYKTYSSQPNIIYFIFKILYVLGWTWVLNTLCNKGYKNISWFLVLLPFIAMFILAGLLFLHLQSLL